MMLGLDKVAVAHAHQHTQAVAMMDVQVQTRCKHKTDEFASSRSDSLYVFFRDMYQERGGTKITDDSAPAVQRQ